MFMENVCHLPASRQEKRNYWSQHIEDWKSSGLTQSQYCDKQQLKLSTFRYWKARLTRLHLSKPLIPVTVKTEVTSATRSFPSGISLAVNDRIRLDLEIGFNGDTFLNVLDLLESR